MDGERERERKKMGHRYIHIYSYMYIERKLIFKIWITFLDIVNYFMI